MALYTGGDGEWEDDPTPMACATVVIAADVSRALRPIDARCERCTRLNCGPYWFSIKTRRVRCYRCFDPNTEAVVP